jgi:hypothetical protein
MSKEITIQGVVVSVTAPYLAGHVVTEAEAKALNQVRAENIGNNVRKAIQTLIEEAGGDKAAVKEKAQEIVSAKDAGYEFTLASVGGGSTASLDPLTKECRAVARNFVTAKLKEAGMTKKSYNEANGEEAFESKVIELSEHPEVVRVAKKNLAARENLAGLGDIMSGTPAA